MRVSPCVQIFFPSRSFACFCAGWGRTHVVHLLSVAVNQLKGLHVSILPFSSFLSQSACRPRKSDYFVFVLSLEQKSASSKDELMQEEVKIPLLRNLWAVVPNLSISHSYSR